MGIWSYGIDEDVIRGPWLALKRMLLALGEIETDYSISLLHHSDSDDEIFAAFPDKTTNNRVPRGLSSRIYSSEYDLMVFNIPAVGVKSYLQKFEFLPLNCPSLIWVHGTGPFVEEKAYDRTSKTSFPHNLSRNLNLRAMEKSLNNYNFIFTNSKFTKKTLERGLNVEAPIKKNYLGVEEIFFQRHDTGILGEKVDEYDYILLHVSNYSWRKNTRTVLEASKILHDQGYSHLLVIVGDRYEQSGMMAYTNKLSIRDHTIFTGYISDKELADIYRLSDIFVHPSLYEGFGLPLVEAMAGHCPIITSNYSAMPEIAGEAALLLNDPTDEYELADQARHLFDNPETRRDLGNVGAKRAAQFTWERCAQKFDTRIQKMLKP